MESYEMQVKLEELLGETTLNELLENLAEVVFLKVEHEHDNKKADSLEEAGRLIASLSGKVSPL